MKGFINKGFEPGLTRIKSKKGESSFGAKGENPDA